MVSGHHIRLIQVSNFLDLNIYAKTPWGPRVSVKLCCSPAPLAIIILSVHEDHHVFLNLLTLKFYCLPDNYEVKDATLEDIRYVLNPTFTDDDVG